jgi:hypothetical protein
MLVPTMVMDFVLFVQIKISSVAGIMHCCLDCRYGSVRLSSNAASNLVPRLSTLRSSYLNKREDTGNEIILD